MSAVRTSKFLSLVLRHQPQKIGIVLDDAGWTDVNALLSALTAHGHAMSRAQLDELVAGSDKQRYALSPDGERIRANQGHSVDVELDLPQVAPPARLYHGTVAEFLGSIREKGLIKGARHHVHMSADLETATKVGGRRGKPVILTVRAEAMADAGHAFFRSANGVWLTDHVPPEFLEYPSMSRGDKVRIAEQSLAACEAGRYANATGGIVELTALIARAVDGTVTRDLRTYTSPAIRPRVTATKISVTGESTIDALRRLAAGGGHVGCLNFASAKNPGGGFLGGAQAQEESLARSSALYPCLQVQPEHYARNKANRSALYLDLAIYSPGVPFFRDDEGGWFAAPVLCSVITCAAPNAGALRQHGRFDASEVEATLRTRAAFVLAIARDEGIEDLVLGAWGAGVFGNDPVVVARAFADLLRGPFDRTFRSVVFAVIGGPGAANHDAFVQVFSDSARSTRP